MNYAAILLIQNHLADVFLLRFDHAGQCVGDTWHLSVEDAKEQAETEFMGNLSVWEEVPPEAEDPIAFSLSRR